MAASGKGLRTMPPHVGIFWFVDGVLVTAGCLLADAAPYGDCLTYDGGHAQLWDHWQGLGSRGLAEHTLPNLILTTQYDDHPRGRVVKAPEGFVIYADRCLQKPASVAKICACFGLNISETKVSSDAHYRSAICWT